MNDQKNADLAFLFVNFVNHPPISDPITITPGKRAFQTFDVWVFIWILPQMLEAVVQSFYERRISPRSAYMLMTRILSPAWIWSSLGIACRIGYGFGFSTEVGTFTSSSKTSVGCSAIVRSNSSP